MLFIAFTLAALADPAPVAAPAPVATAPAERRICLRDTYTGSRLPKTVCRTHAEWKALGLDPLAKQ